MHGTTAYAYYIDLKVVIITLFGAKTKISINAENTTDLPKLYRCLLYVVFRNLEPQMQGSLILKGFTLKKIKGNFCARKSKK